MDSGHAFVSDDQAALYGRVPSDWQLINRRSKVLSVNDITSLVLHIRYESDPFPFSILRNLSDKGKAPIRASSADKQTKNSPIDWTLIALDDGEESDHSDPNPTPPSDQEASRVNSVERFVLTETDQREGAGTLPPLVVSALKDSCTSTRDLVYTRSIATQTDPEIAPPSTTSAENASSTPIPCRQEEVSAIADAPGESATRDSLCSKSEDSILDYIDEEFEALKRSGADMCASKRITRCDKKFAVLEEKYNSMVRRVAHLEKRHDDDIRAVRDEIVRDCCDLDMTTFTECGDHNSTSPDTHSTSCSISKAKSLPPKSYTSGGSLISSTPSWDVNESDMIVCTQDSQGNPVNTRATPLHVKEAAAMKDNQSCVCVDEAQVNPTNAIPPSKPVLRPRNTRPTTTRRDEPVTAQPNAVTKSSAMPTGQSTSMRNPCGDANKIRCSQESHKPSQTVAAKQQNPPPGSASSNIRASKGKQAQPASRTGYRESTSDTVSIVTRSTRDVRPQQDSKQRDSRLAKQKPSDNVMKPSVPDEAKRRKVCDQGSCQPSTSGYTPGEKSSGNSSVGKSTNAVGSETCMNYDSDKSSYAEVASDGEWNVQGGKSNGKKKKRDYPAIKSAAHSKNRELYIKGMSCSDFKAYKDLEEAVKWYCKDRHVSTIHQRVIIYNKENDSVGIKVVVRENDVEKITSRDFWPEGIWIRDWSDDKPKSRDRFFVSDISSSDESL